MGVVIEEIAAALPQSDPAKVVGLARSLVATVQIVGHMLGQVMGHAVGQTVGQMLGQLVGRIAGQDGGQAMAGLT